MKNECVYTTRVGRIKKQAIIKEFRKIGGEMLHRVVTNLRMRIDMCISVEAQFEHLMT